jgi:hypothetical protein
MEQGRTDALILDLNQTVTDLPKEFQCVSYTYQSNKVVTSISTLSRLDNGYHAIKNVGSMTDLQFYADLLSVYAWILIHMALTATDIHHDAAGLITAIICVYGRKFWTVFLPVSPDDSREVLENAMTDFIVGEVAARRKNDKVGYKKCFETLAKKFRPVCFILNPGDVL